MNLRLTISSLLTSALLCAVPAVAQVHAITDAHTQKAREIVSKMTLEEKIDYMGGDTDGFTIRAIPRLGLPAVKMADGPQGMRNGVHSTYYPCGVLSAASWNRDLVRNVGRGIGADCRSYGVGIILAPGVNIYRAPMCGRNFEYFGEDPYLASETALEYVLGVQEMGTIATIKHFAANNQEWDRLTVSSDVDERTMEEIYFPTFRKAITKGGVGAVMCSYNLLNGVYTAENEWLLRTKLRDEWGFKGILMSDWGATVSAFNSCMNGLDLEMPDARFMNRKNLMPLVESGVLPESVIDEHVVNIMRTLISFGLLDKPLEATHEDGVELPESRRAALEMAREGIVLLKNDGNVLPLRGSVAVIGPNADRVVKGGGSGEVHPLNAITLWGGLKAASKKAHLIAEDVWLRDLSLDYKAEYFANRNLEGTPAVTRQESGLDHEWGEAAPAEGVPADGFSARWSTTFTLDADSEVLIEATGDDGYRVMLDGDEICADWTDHAASTRTRLLSLKGGKSYRIAMEYYDNARDAVAKLHVKVHNTGSLRAALQKYDNIVVSLGFDKSTESEGFDRTFAIDPMQINLLNEAIATGKNVIVVINSGGGVEMASWIDKVKAVVMAWYPGEEGGTALAEILTGKISPSGKLPMTIEKRIEDNPSIANYYENQETKKRVIYGEGIFCGYRGYDRNGVEPLFPFGFGLSYTTFAYSNISVEKTGDFEALVSFDVTNTGKRDAAEVAQVYVSDTECSIVRPVKELKGYDKVMLKRGETKRISIKLSRDAFSFYDVKQHRFTAEPGEFVIHAGPSSATLPLSATVKF